MACDCHKSNALWADHNDAASVIIIIIISLFGHDEGLCGSGTVSTLTADLGSEWMYVVSFQSLTLYPEKENPVPIEHEAE